jgi:hypothetical protein
VQLAGRGRELRAPLTRSSSSSARSLHRRRRSGNGGLPLLLLLLLLLLHPPPPRLRRRSRCRRGLGPHCGRRLPLALLPLLLLQLSVLALQRRRAPLLVLIVQILQGIPGGLLGLVLLMQQVLVAMRALRRRGKKEERGIHDVRSRSKSGSRSKSRSKSRSRSEWRQAGQQRVEWRVLLPALLPFLQPLSPPFPPPLALSSPLPPSRHPSQATHVWHCHEALWRQDLRHVPQHLLQLSLVVEQAEHLEVLCRGEEWGWGCRVGGEE